MFNNDNEVTHAVGVLPDDYDSTVVHKRVNGEWVLEGTYASSKGVSVPRPLAQDRSQQDPLHGQPRRADHGYYWVDVKTGKKELIYRDPRVDIDDIVFNDEDEAVAVLHQL